MELSGLDLGVVRARFFKTAQNPKKWTPKKVAVPSKIGSENDAISTSILEHLGSAFGGRDGSKTSFFGDHKVKVSFRPSCSRVAA